MAILLGVSASAAAHAQGWKKHHSHVHFGLFIGAPAFAYWPYYYPYPPAYYYYPPALHVPAAAPVYVERGAPAEQPAAQWWYYCADARTYYPYVRQCPGGWQRVAPQPPPG